MPKVVLYFPETHSSRREDPWCLPPLSLLAIAAPLVEAGYEVCIVDARRQPDYVQRVLDEAKDSICVGMSVLTGCQILGGLEVARAIKRDLPGIPVVWGGYHPTLLPHQTIADPSIDAVVRGQGERTFKALVDALAEGARLDGISGLLFKDQSRIVENPMRSFEDINGFPPFPYHLIDVAAHFPSLEFGKRIVAYVSSQGCPHPCAFCAESAAYGRRWSGLNPDRVGQELERLVRQYNADGVIFVDNNFFADEKRVQGICNEIIRRGLKFRWAAQGRADRIAGLSPETFGLLRKSNFEVFHVGAESGSTRVLDIALKTMPRETILECARLCKRQGIRISFGFIFGFPDETEKDIQDNFSLMEEVTDIQGAYDCIVHFYAPCPGTPLAASAAERGARNPENLLEWGAFNTVRGITPWVDARYIDRIRRRTDFFYPFARPNELLMRTRVRGLAARILVRAFSLSCRLRWRIGWYVLPVEWWLYKCGRWAIAKVAQGGFTA
jgi:radical SAM superfamily enzyme YgiQ (UPF0313 family)